MKQTDRDDNDMAAPNSAMILLLILIGTVYCQIHYVPASILIPTFNGSLVPNYSAYNKSNVSSVPLNGNQRPPYNLGNNNSYNLNGSSIYNQSQDGHLIVGRVQVFDRLLFRQVCISIIFVSKTFQS